MRRATIAGMTLAVATVLVTFDYTAEQPKSAGAGGDQAGAGAAHVIVAAEDVRWADAPSLPPGAKTALLEGDPKAEGFFTMRAKLPANYRIPAHWHPVAERVTVLSGKLHLGMGERFDDSAGTVLAAGGYASMPAGMRHFAWTEGETILQISTIGPWGINYVNPADDPRKSAAAGAESPKR